MPDDVIDRVHSLARRQKANPGLVFLHRNRVADTDDDGSYFSGTDDEADSEEDTEYEPNVAEDDESEYSLRSDADGESEEGSENEPDDDSDNEESEEESEIETDDDPDIDSETEPDDVQHVDIGDNDFLAGVAQNDSDETVDITGVAQNETADITGVDQNDTDDDDDDDDDDVETRDQNQVEAEMAAKYGPRTNRYNLRQRKTPDYSHLFTNAASEEPLATPQMSMKKGLKVFGKEGADAVRTELLQLHTRKVMEPKKGRRTDPRTKERGTGLPYVPQAKKKWKGEGTRMCRWS